MGSMKNKRSKTTQSVCFEHRRKQLGWSSMDPRSPTVGVTSMSPMSAANTIGSAKRLARSQMIARRRLRICLFDNCVNWLASIAH